MKFPRQLLTSSFSIRRLAQSLIVPAPDAPGANRNRAADPALEALRSGLNSRQTEPAASRASLVGHFLPVEGLRPPAAPATHARTPAQARATDSAAPSCAGFANRVVPHTWRWPICPRLYMHYPQTVEKWTAVVHELTLKDFSIGEMQQWVDDFDSLARPDAAFSAAEFNHYYAYLMDGNVADPAQRENYLRLRQAFCAAIAAGMPHVILMKT